MLREGWDFKSQFSLSLLGHHRTAEPFHLFTPLTARAAPFNLPKHTLRLLHSTVIFTWGFLQGFWQVEAVRVLDGVGDSLRLDTHNTHARPLLSQTRGLIWHLWVGEFEGGGGRELRGRGGLC